jgi:acyl-CoA oxidase
MPHPVPTAPDADALRTVLDGPYGHLRDLVREALSLPELAPVHGLPSDVYRERVLAQARRLAEEGGTGFGFPTEFGGGGEVGGAVSAFETLGYGDLSLLVKCGVQFGLFGGAVLNLGNREQHERYLPDIISLDLPGAFAMTETGHGSDVQNLRTTATYDADGDAFVIDTPDVGARKDYIGNAAAHGRMAAVFAQLRTRGESHGVHCFLVPIRDADGAPCPGVEITDCGDKAGLNGVDNGRLSFDGVRVPRSALLDRFGSVDRDGTYTSPIENETRRFFTMLGTLITGRISVSGAAGSATKVALAIAVRYAEGRTQFTAPGSEEENTILDYLAHQRRLLPALATTYALHFAQEQLVGELHRSMTDDDYPERDRRKLETHAAGLKAITTWHATSTIQTAREACGGAGYLAVNRLPQLKADTDVFTTFEGDNTVLLQLVAKTLLTDFRDEFGDLDTLGMVRFVADHISTTVLERTAARSLISALIGALPGSDEEKDLLDRGTHLELLEFRESHVISGVARRLKAGIDAGRDPFDVFNTCQDHVLLAARAHIDRIVLESFVAAIDRVEDPDVARLLSRVCDLHALSTIEAERAWFLEHGRLTGARSKAVTAAVNRLCGELRPHARLLVDAFGIPDQALGAPIALGDHSSPPAEPPPPVRTTARSTAA